MDLSEILRDLIRLQEEQALTGAAWAHAAGITPAAVSYLKSGKRNPTWAILTALAPPVGRRLVPLYGPPGSERPGRLISLCADLGDEDLAILEQIAEALPWVQDRVALQAVLVLIEAAAAPPPDPDSEEARAPGAARRRRGV